MDYKTMEQAGIENFYDGECPFCSSYVSLLNLRSQVGTVALIDARTNDPRLADIHVASLNLDDGMGVRYGGQLYHGPDAVWLLATLSETGGTFSSLMRWLLRSPRRARVVYRLMVAGRRLMLTFLGKSRLGH